MVLLCVLAGSGFAGWYSGCVLGCTLGDILGGILCCTLGGTLGGFWVISCAPKCYAGSLVNILGDIVGRILDDIRGGFKMDF